MIVRKRVEDVNAGDWIVGRPQVPLADGPWRVRRIVHSTASGNVRLTLQAGERWMEWSQLRGALVDTREEAIQ